MTRAATPQVLVSLHDVTPVHGHRLAAAEALLVASGVRSVAYLLVPDFHRLGRSSAEAAFVDWCRSPRPYAVDWVLHGFYHQADAVSHASLRDRLAQRVLTGGEGEFLSLDPGGVRDRLRDGVAEFTRVIGRAPRAFVPPAWLAGAGLASALRHAGLVYTEDHRSVRDVSAARARSAPVVTWATRTLVHRWSSPSACDALARAYARRPLIRIALHPHDFDHPAVVRSIRRVLDHALRGRDAVTLGPELFETA